MTRIGTPTRQGRAAIGLTQTAAMTTRSAVTQAIEVSGIANLIVRARASSMAVVRETRSPIPARSTVESGERQHCARMKSSRSSANIRLGEDEGGTPRKEGEDRLRDQEDGEDRDHTVDLRRVNVRL